MWKELPGYSRSRSEETHKERKQKLGGMHGKEQLVLGTEPKGHAEKKCIWLQVGTNNSWCKGVRR